MSEQEASKDSQNQHSEPQDFEQALKELEQIVKDLEQGDLPLASSLSRYERGVNLVGTCEQLLSEVENRIFELQNGNSLKEIKPSASSSDVHTNK